MNEHKKSMTSLTLTSDICSKGCQPEFKNSPMFPGHTIIACNVVNFA